MKKLVLLVAVVVMFGLMVSPVQAGWGCKDGADGADGTNGVDGVAGINGADGVNGKDCDCREQENKLGIGIDYILYEKGDETSSNLNDVSWLRSITLENRIDLNNNKPLKRGYEGYVVFTLKK